MIFSIHIGNTTILDLRHIAIILSGIYGGIIPTIVRGVIIGIFRISYFGVNISSVIASINMLNIAIVCSFILEAKIKEWKKWLFMNLYALIMITISLVILLKNRNDIIYIFLNYWIIAISAGVFVYYLVWHVKTDNERFRMFKEQSIKDFLTGLNNVREFDLVLNKLINKVKEDKEKLSILIIDIDYFKKVNDTHGHQNGNLVLQELGRILCRSCRTGDIISRIGGEEFSILLPNCSYYQALEVGERIRRDIQNHKFILLDNANINVTVSIGVATYPDTVGNLDELVMKADEALYKAKQTGRNKVCACI
ncbi:diguanylate cyclase [Tepidibacter formicigenes DSM 15518]|uniref:Diguanylate cyclase n=2 Tax=Tepidibacter TaxID=214904 RepID=A0A1M6TS43_9FIRM|nr:diguanylate cyclase [Tepidibacter formicigenes DSM 15518]